MKQYPCPEKKIVYSKKSCFVRCDTCAGTGVSDTKVKPSPCIVCIVLVRLSVPASTHHGVFTGKDFGMAIKRVTVVSMSLAASRSNGVCSYQSDRNYYITAPGSKPKGILSISCQVHFLYFLIDSVGTVGAVGKTPSFLSSPNY